MAKYTYTIVNRQGVSEKGQINAVSEESAAGQIKKEGWFIVSLYSSSNRLNFSLFKSSKEKMSSFERIIFTDHLAAMFRSGTPLVDALETFRDDEGKSEAIIDSLIGDIQQGKKLSEAMASYPSVFAPLYLALVQSGELTGSLDETIGYLAKELKREHEFKEKIKTAMFYPALVIFVAILVITMLVLVVIPKILVITQSFSDDLPLMTRIVASGASFLASFGPLIGLFLLLLVITSIILLRRQSTKAKIDPLLLNFPLIGKLMKKYILARFLRIVGSCLKYGVPLSASFNTVEEVVGNTTYRRACQRINSKILRGISLSEAISEENIELFPRVIVRTIKGAEKTGTVDEAMLRLSQFYEDEIDRGMKRITDLIEPALVVVLGIVVAAIAIAVVAPIYQMTSRIK